MNLDFFKLKSIYLENTVVRNPRVGSKNRPTSRTIDVGCTGVNSVDDIYTGEAGVNSEYLIQGSVNGTVIKGSSGTFTLNSNVITNIQSINGLLPGETVKCGDLLRADGRDEFYPVTGMSNDLKTIWLQDNNTTVKGVNNFQVRKTKLDSTHFEYIKSDAGDNKFFYDKNNRDWGYTGIQGFTGPLIAESDKKAYIKDDPVTFQFYPSYSSMAPDVTSIDTTATDPKEPYGQKVLENKLISDTSDIILNPIPYPDDDENFRLYWGPQDNVTLKTKDVDYTINYTMDPDYTSVKLPYDKRTVAYVKFLNELKDTIQINNIGIGFQGVFNIHEDPSTSATKQARGITNIFPNSKGLKIPGDSKEYTSEIIRVGKKVLGKYFDYNLEYNNGIINFIRHPNLELDVPNVLYNQDLIWDGVSIVKGVGLTGLKTSDPANLVIPYGIAGLTGINGSVYFEDIDENDFKKGTDYIFEYQSGAIKLNKSLKSGECVLVSYFVEGEDVVGEKLNLKTLRTEKYPIIESSITIKKNYSDKSITSTGIKMLIEGVDYKVFYLTGTIVLLNTSVTENLDSLEVSYTPFSQVQCILQPIANDPKKYLITIVDDKLKVIDPFNLKFSVINPIISTAKPDPFGENPTTYDNAVIPGSLLSVKGEGEPGYGLNNLTEEQMIEIGITGLHYMGLDKKLGKTPEEFYAIGLTGIIELGIVPGKDQIYDVTNYKYDDVSKELTLDTSYNANKSRPDLNDLILATYSYVGDVLPYAPVQIIFPVFNQDDNSILIEGFDKTNVIYPGMILRVDNFDPQKYYYFKINGVEYDGINTIITLASSFPEDIRNPSFYIFDDILNWYPLPKGTTVDSTVTIGTDTLTFSGNPLETKDLLRPQTLMCIGGTDIYEILSTAIVDSNTLQVKIFPNLQNEYPSSILISDPVYQEGATDVISKYPIITDPPHPAFTIRYVKPTNAIYGMATIYIDGEKIILSEIVDSQTFTFNFYFKDFAGVRDIANAIKNTISGGTSGSHYPFTLMSQDGTVEQYYIGSGFWSSNLILPFAQDQSVIIPNEGYLVTIKQEVFRYILIKAYKNTSNFLVEQKDRRDYFSRGNLLSFRSKSSGNLSFFEISDVGIVQEKISDTKTLTHTKVSFKDAFRENMIAPYTYKYDFINWINVSSPYFSIDQGNSQISLSSDLPLFKQNSFVKIDDSFIYQIKNVSVYDTVTTLTLNPTLSSNIKKISTLRISDFPVYLDGISPQPSIFINYTVHTGYSGAAFVKIDDKNITITEKLAGFSEHTAKISLTQYDNLNQLAQALNRVQLTIPGYNPLSVNTAAYKDVFSTGGRSLLLVPTMQDVSLPANIAVSKPIFKINYTSPDGSTDFKITIPSDGSNTIKFSEWKRSDKPGTLKISTVSYNNKIVIGVIDEILNLDSIVPGHKPWSVGAHNYDSYFAANKSWYYTIIPFPGSDKDSVPYSVQAIENPQFWYQVGILNRNVLIENTDYTIDGTQVVLTNPIKVSERYELSYLGINDLAEYEGQSITCSCRYFYKIPAGYQIKVYMDYLNPDQYYIQKLTERKFLEIVTQPQIKDILQQAGNSVGMGNDSGSDNSANNWDGGLVDLYYYLKDEKIKSQIYIKLFNWYRHRLRNFASEAQLIMGIKYGHCNFYGIKRNGQYTLEDSYVEDNNYTLTKMSDLDQIKNGFSKFFPIGYEGNAPQPYARFKSAYQSYNEAFCYNIQYIDENNNVLNTEGRVISSNPYWADVVDKSTTFSNLDFDILPYDQESSFISGITGPLYSVPYNQEDKHFRVTDNNFKFLRRISVGDQVQILDLKNTYNIASIKNNISVQPVIIKCSNGDPLTYDGITEGTVLVPGKLPVYGSYLENYSYVLSTDTPTTNPIGYPVGVPVLRDVNGNVTGLGYRVISPTSSYDILILENGKYFTDSGIPTFVVKKLIQNNTVTWKYVTDRVNWTLQDLEDNLPKDGQNIFVTRNNNKDFPVIFPAWDDEFNLGAKVVGLRIINQKKNTDVIRKPFSFIDLLGLDQQDKYFTIYEGTYDELTGIYKILNTVNINLKYLTFFEERRVSLVLDSIRYNLTGHTYPLPFLPYILKLSNIYNKKDNLGADKFFYVDFDKYYEINAKDGYNESIVFRSRNRNSWVQYAVDEDNDFVDPEYGFSSASVYKNFYDPNNLYLKLVIERQCWLTELNILKDIFDTNNKLERAYTFSEGKPIPQAEFFNYLSQISCGDNVNPLPSCIKYRIASYAENLRFLLDRLDQIHPYLVDNTSGPLYRTMLDPPPISTPMDNSYNQAVEAYEKYLLFQSECGRYYNLNNFYYNKWQREYAKWVLSLEQGTIFQKDAKENYKQSIDNYINLGFRTFPAVKISTIDQGIKPTFTASEAKYVVTYNMLATYNSDQDEYDDATLIIQYKLSGIKDTQQFAFILKDYPTLQNLIDGINSKCVHPVLKTQVLSALCVFDYYPYRNYSTKWILRTYRATPDNDSNGPDTIGGDGWTVLSTDPAVDDRMYVCNVLDHRNYDSRIFFMSRMNIHNDSLTINSQNIVAFPYYVDTQDNTILSKMGPVPVAGRWAKDDASSTETVDYTTEFNVLDIKPGVDNATVINYEFLDYVQGEEQTPGEQTPRNPTYQTSTKDLMKIGYNPETLILSEDPPKEEVESGTDIILDSNLQALNAIVDSNKIQPVSKIIRDLKVTLRIKNQVKPDEYKDASFVFPLRQYTTINDLNYALNNNHYASDSDGNIIVDANGNAAIAPMGEGYFSSTLIGTEDLQGRMKTVDIATQYTQQLIYVSSYEYWKVNPTEEYDYSKNKYITYTNPVKITEPMGKYYAVGWQLREQGVINGKQIIFRIDPRTYSPSYNYRFKPYDPRIARTTIFLDEKKDILAFDLYSWDDDAQYRIKDNILYLRSAIITDPVQIPLYKTSNLDNSIDHPEEKLKVIDVIRLINNNGTCNKNFFANLRFGREYNSDYDYAYFPDTEIWAGNNGWVPIIQVILDYLYLDKDVVFSLASEGANPKYQVVPITTVPVSDNIVYKSQALILSADVDAFEIHLNTIHFNNALASYSVDSTLLTMTLTGSYVNNTDEFSDFPISSIITMQDLVDSINLDPAFTASMYSMDRVGLPSSNLDNGTNLSIANPTRLVASFTEDHSYTVNLDLLSFTTIGSLIDGINSIVIPSIYGIGGTGYYAFQASNAGIPNSTLSTALNDVLTENLPTVLLALINKNAINLNKSYGNLYYSILSANVAKSGTTLTLNYTARYVFDKIPVINVSVNAPGYTGRTYYVDKILNKITLNYISNVTNNFVHNIDLTVEDTLNKVIANIDSFIPSGASNAFFISNLKWINGLDSSSKLLDATDVSIVQSNVLMRGSQEYPLLVGSTSIKIGELVSEINLTTYATGFSAIDLESEAYIGYQGLPANLLIPIVGEHPFTDPLYFDFRNVLAAYLLNMSHTTRSTKTGSESKITDSGEPCKCTVSSDGTITFEKAVSSLINTNFIGYTYSYNVKNKNIKKFMNDSMNLDGYLEAPSSQYPNFSYAVGKGILSMDVAIIPMEGITYGILRLRSKSETNPDAVANVSNIDLAINDPEVLNTHVYFGFLGDIRFYQISDYNLWKQYILVKRRLGLPWNKTNDVFVPDYYVPNDKYNFSSYEYTLNLVQNSKFLNYLKHIRFDQLANSLKLEDLYNNKYFWLYLKFHKEIGCDQKVIALTKKIQEDDQKAKLLM